MNTALPSRYSLTRSVFFVLVSIVHAHQRSYLNYTTVSREVRLINNFTLLTVENGFSFAVEQYPERWRMRVEDGVKRPNEDRSESKLLFAVAPSSLQYEPSVLPLHSPAEFGVHKTVHSRRIQNQ
jgi:hypothetical protein